MIPALTSLPCPDRVKRRLNEPEMRFPLYHLGADIVTTRQHVSEVQQRKSPVYSIILSARSTNPAGISWPIACAVLRLMTSSKLVGCSIGMSAGLTPRNSFDDHPRRLTKDAGQASAISYEATFFRHFRPFVDGR